MIKISITYLLSLFITGLFLVGCNFPPSIPQPPPKFHNGQAVVIRGLNVKGVVHYQWNDNVQIYYVDNNGQIQSQYVRESELESAELEIK